MANTGRPHSGGSQFFLVDGAGGAQLGKPAFAMFGQIIAGLAAADKINAEGGTLADNGVPPRVLNKILSVTITVGAPGSTTGTSTTSVGGVTTTAPSTTPTT